MATELVGIQLELMGADGVKRDLQNLDKLLDSLGGRKKFDAGFNEAKNQVVQYRGELEKLKREQAKLEKGSDEWNDKASEIENVKNKLRDAQQAVREFGRASQQAGKTFMQTFNSISSKVAHVGSAMQSLGNALTRMTSPFSRLTTGLLYGAGYKALNTLTEGLSGSFTRADTMNKYARLMKEYETANYTAIQSRQDLDDSIQGLPIALDDAISLAQRYTLSLGDMERGTQLAIATNNAFLASMATETQRYQGMLQLQDLMNGKDLTSREWMSLGSSMGKAINEVGLKLGYSKDQLGEFRQELYAGNIATKDFLDALIAVGTGKGSLVDLAKVSAQTWEGLFSNIRIAVTRAGASIVETLNDTFKDATGRTLLQQLLGIDAEGKKMGDGIRDWIDGISKSVQNWIKANPDKILEFFNELKSIDWEGLVKGFAEGMMWFARMMGAFAQWASNKDLEKIGRWLPKINLFGKVLTILGGFLKGTRHIWGFLGAGAMRLGGGKLAKIGIFGKIASFFGKKKDIETASETAATVTKASPKLISAFKNMALLSGIIAIPSLTAWGVTASAKASVKNFKEIIDTLKDVNWKDAAKVLGGIAVYLGGSAGLGALAGKLATTKPDFAVYTIIGETVLGIITGIASAFFHFDMSQISKGIKNFADAVKALDEIPDLEDADALLNKVENAVGVMNRITTLLKGEAPDVVTAGNMNGNGGLQGMGWLESFEIGNLSKAIKALVDMGSSLMQLSSINLPENAQANAEKVASVASSVANSLGRIGTGFGGISNIGNAISSWGISATMKNVVTELYQLRRMAHHLTALASVSVSETAVDNIDKLIEAVVKVANRLGGIGSGFGGWGNMISSAGIKSTMKNVANQLYQLRRMAFSINKLAGMSVNVDGFTATVGLIQDALAELKSAEGDFELDITVKLSTGFKTSVNNTVRQIKKGNKDIRDALDDMPSTLTKQLTVNLTARVNVAQAVSAINSGTSLVRNIAQNAVAKYSATGGMIYRAKGGGVPYFKRRGTDTVPAMLTPGEYVHNKRAVSTFGIDFMRKVNNLDVKGAMNELMHRAGGMANINRGVSITNNNYNNQKVTINNSNNAGAGFTFKSASRFVGAF